MTAGRLLADAVAFQQGDSGIFQRQPFHEAVAQDEPLLGGEALHRPLDGLDVALSLAGGFRIVEEGAVVVRQVAGIEQALQVLVALGHGEGGFQRDRTLLDHRLD